MKSRIQTRTGKKTASSHLLYGEINWSEDEEREKDTFKPCDKLIDESLCVCSVAQSCLTLWASHGLKPSSLFCLWHFPDKIKLSFPAPGDLPDSGIKPASLASPTFAGRFFTIAAAAAAAKLLHSCLTLCDPIEGRPQAPPSLGFSRQEHWSGLPFPSPMKKRKVKVKSLSRVRLLATPWTAAYQAPPW